MIMFSLVPLERVWIVDCIYKPEKKKHSKTPDNWDLTLSSTSVFSDLDLLLGDKQNTGKLNN